MTIKNIFKVHYLFYFVSFICVITGFFKPFIYITILILIHELGHLLGALYYKWKIEKIIIFPFGGLTLFKEHLNKPIKEEFIILIMGPLFQIIFYVIVTYLFGYNSEFTNYHYTLLFFNLMPIYPLDGSKLLKLFFEKIFSFKLSHLLTLITSILWVIIILINLNNNLVLILFITLLFIKVIEEFKNHNNIFNKFLFERYLYNFDFKKTYTINNEKITKMKKDYRHLFKNKNKYLTEKQVLNKRFDFNKKM